MMNYPLIGGAGNEPQYKPDPNAALQLMHWSDCLMAFIDTVIITIIIYLLRLIRTIWFKIQRLNLNTQWVMHCMLIIMITYETELLN